ncbi:MAG TPA: MFS transporter [Gammaproteobacteria bacterium]
MRLPAPYGRLLLPVYVPSLLMAMSQEALLILLPLYALELGAAPAYAALVVGVRGIGVLLFDVPAGMLVARFGDKPVLIGGLTAILVGLLLLAAAQGPLSLAAAALLLGAGHAAWMLGRQSYIADTCANDEIGRAITVMAGLNRAGAFLGPAAGGLIAGALGYPAAFVAGAGAALAAAVLALGFAEHAAPASVEPHELGWRGTARVVRAHARVFATAGVAAFVLQLMRSTRQLLVPLFGQAIGLDVAVIGLVYSLSSALDMSLFYPVGVVVDRWGRKWSAVPSTALYALGLALLPAASGFGSLLAVALLLGLANGLGTGIVMIMGADLARQSGQQGQFLGVWRVLGDSGITIAPLAVGAVVEAAGLAAASGAVAAVGLVGAVLVTFFVSETLERARPPVT